MLLITGAAGFVGSRVRKAALAASLPVITSARRPGEGIDVAADLARTEEAARLPFDRITAVIHCAAAIPARSKDFGRDNDLAAQNFADALAAAPHLSRVVHVSSVSVYGWPQSGGFVLDESWPLMEAGDPGSSDYGLSKRATERAFDALAERRSEISVTHLRASSVYGPGMAKTTLLPVIAGRFARNEPVTLKGPRTYVQNFVHVDDVAELALALAPPSAAQAGFAAVNAFSDDCYGLFDLVALLRAGLRSDSLVIDETTDAPIAMPQYVNERAKTFHRRFRALRDQIGDVL